MPACSLFTAEDLPAAAALAADEPELISKLRWHHHTPYANVVKAEADGKLAGFAFGLAHANHGVVQDVFVYPTFMDMGFGTALVDGLLSWMELQGSLAQSVVAQPGTERFWSRMGFRPFIGLLSYAEGTFDNASREEVLAVEPPHLLAIARLDQQAFGVDRSRWLREHADLGSVYLEGSRVRGFALPLAGQGLIVADHPAIGLELQRWLLPVQNRLILPVGNRAAHEHLVRRKYQVCEAGRWMVRGHFPQFQPALIFAYP